MSSSTRAVVAALAVCVLLPTRPAGCGGGAQGRPGRASPAPVGTILVRTDEQGRHYRQVDRKAAPEVGLEVQPDAGGSRDVRLTVRRIRFSPAGAAARPVAGRGLAYLLVDGRLVSRLRAREYHLSARLVPRGTHHVTARLYADDDTAWAVAGKPVQSTADITASEPTVTASPRGTRAGRGGSALSAPGGRPRTGGRASPDRDGKAS
ncbi:hypothetical protein [Streptomyces sp. NPDC046197]|uniref:hypothetical protein n=1 Tax=Streptomyces sp. NPDC046197 TaxID=3154337 RepID=UPI0033CA2147